MAVNAYNSSSKEAKMMEFLFETNFKNLVRTHLSPSNLNGTLKHSILLHRVDQLVSEQPSGRTPHSLGFYMGEKPQAPPSPVSASLTNQQESVCR